ncbi:MAG: tetratricopeptide repeat protein, partial [Nannocystaceae bacterium]|nr:tetratricopeptide repeat protein [Nannocystaceae bacterium]
DVYKRQILISLSGFEGARGDLDRAIETGMEAVNTLERLDGGPSRQSLSALGNVGLALDSAGRLDEAQALFERELRERTAIIGPDDPEHLAALINLGLVALHQGRTQEARARWTAADVVVERYYGKRHPDRADIALDLAWMDDAAGKHAEAERRYAWATRVFEETLGHEAEKTLLAHSGLSTARLRQGKIQAACRPLDALTETARGALGETRALAILLEARGDCAAARDKPAEAESVYRSALDVMNQSSEPAEAQADLHLKLASTLWDQGKESDAQALVGALAVDTKSVEAWREAH